MAMAKQRAAEARAAKMGSDKRAHLRRSGLDASMRRRSLDALSDAGQTEVNASQMKIENLWDILAKIALLGKQRKEHMFGAAHGGEVADELAIVTFKNTESNIVFGTLSVLRTVANLHAFQSEMFSGASAIASRVRDTAVVGGGAAVVGGGHGVGGGDEITAELLAGRPMDQFTMSDLLLSLLSCGFDSLTNGLILDCVSRLIDCLKYSFVQHPLAHLTMADATARMPTHGSSIAGTTTAVAGSGGSRLLQQIHMPPVRILCEDAEYCRHRLQWRKTMAAKVWNSLHVIGILNEKFGIQLDVIEGSSMDTDATYPATVAFLRLLATLSEALPLPLPSHFFPNGAAMIGGRLGASQSSAGFEEDYSTMMATTTDRRVAVASAAEVQRIHETMSLFDCLCYARNLIFWRWNLRGYKLVSEKLDMSNLALRFMSSILDRSNVCAEMAAVLNDACAQVLFPLSEEQRRAKAAEKRDRQLADGSTAVSRMRVVSPTRRHRFDDGSSTELTDLDALFRRVHLKDSLKLIMCEFPAFELLCDVMSYRSKTLDVLISQAFHSSFEMLKLASVLAEELTHCCSDSLLSADAQSATAVADYDEKGAATSSSTAAMRKRTPVIDLNPATVKKAEANLYACLRLIESILRREDECIAFVTEKSSERSMAGGSVHSLSRLDLRPLSAILLNHTEYRKVIPLISACANYRSVVADVIAKCAVSSELSAMGGVDFSLGGEEPEDEEAEGIVVGGVTPAAAEIPAVAIRILAHLLRRSNDTLLSAPIALQSAAYGVAKAGAMDATAADLMLRVFEERSEDLDTLRTAFAEQLSDLRNPSVCIGIVEFLLESMKVPLVQCSTGGSGALPTRGSGSGVALDSIIGEVLFKDKSKAQKRQQCLKHNLALILLNLSSKVGGSGVDLVMDADSLEDTYLLDLVMDALLSPDTASILLRAATGSEQTQDWAPFYEALLELVLTVLHLDNGFHAPVFDTYSRALVSAAAVDIGLVAAGSRDEEQLGAANLSLTNAFVQSLSLVLQNTHHELVPASAFSPESGELSAVGFVDCSLYQNCLLSIRSYAMQCVAVYYTNAAFNSMAAFNAGFTPDDTEIVAKNDLIYLGLDLAADGASADGCGAIGLVLRELTYLDVALSRMRSGPSALVLVSESISHFWGISLEQFKVFHTASGGAHLSTAKASANGRTQRRVPHVGGTVGGGRMSQLLAEDSDDAFEWDVDAMLQALDAHLSVRFGAEAMRGTGDGGMVVDGAADASALCDEYNAMVCEQREVLRRAMAENQYRVFGRSLEDCTLRFSQMLSALFTVTLLRRTWASARTDATAPTNSDTAVVKLMFECLSALKQPLSAHTAACLSRVIVQFWSQIAMCDGKDVAIAISMDDLILVFELLLSVTVEYSAKMDAFVTTKLNLYSTLLLFEDYCAAVASDSLLLSSVVGSAKAGTAPLKAMADFEDDDIDLAEFKLEFESKMTAALSAESRMELITGILFEDCLTAAAALVQSGSRRAALSKTELARNSANIALCNSSALALCALLSKYLPGSGQWPAGGFLTKLTEFAIGLFERIEAMSAFYERRAAASSEAKSAPVFEVYCNLVSLLTALCSLESASSMAVSSEAISHNLVSRLLLPDAVELSHRGLLVHLRLLTSLLDANAQNCRLHCQTLNGLFVLSPRNLALFSEALSTDSLATALSAQQLCEFKTLAHCVVAHLAKAYSFPIRLDILQTAGGGGAKEERLQMVQLQLASVLCVEALTRALFDACYNVQQSVSELFENNSPTAAQSIEAWLQLALAIFSVLRVASGTQPRDAQRSEGQLVDETCLKCLALVTETCDQLMSRVSASPSVFDFANSTQSQATARSVLFANCHLLCLCLEHCTVLLFDDWSQLSSAMAEEMSSTLTQVYGAPVATAQPLIAQLSDCFSKLNQWLDSDSCLLNAASVVPNVDQSCSEALENTHNLIEVVLSAFEQQCNALRHSTLPKQIKSLAL